MTHSNQLGSPSPVNGRDSGPALDPTTPADYRVLLGRVPTSVAVVAAVVGRRPAGLVVGSFTSVSLTPPLVGFFVADGSSTWPLIEPIGRFAISVLAAAQADVSRTFAAKGSDRFGACAWHYTPGRQPAIDGAVAWLDCTTESVCAAGDHRLVIGRVEAMGHGTGDDPLVFLGGTYTKLAKGEE